MLVRVVFPYLVRYFRKSGRLPRTEAFLAQTLVEIEEVSAADSPVVYRVGSRHRKRDLPGWFPPALPRSVVLWRDRLFWPVTDVFETRRVPAKMWMAELGKQRGNHIGAGLRLDAFLPDVLDLRRLLDGRDWPQRTFDQALDVREVVHDGRPDAELHVARMARRIVIRDGHLHAEQGEPVWKLELEVFRFSGEPPMRILSCDMESAMAGGQLPFLNYEIFRADRLADALARRAVLVDPARVSVADDGKLEELAGHSNKDDVLAPMLRALIRRAGVDVARRQALVDRPGAQLLRMIEATLGRMERRPKTGGKPVDNSQNPSAAGPNSPLWLRPFADLAACPQSAGVDEISGHLAEFLDRLKDPTAQSWLQAEAGPLGRDLPLAARRALERIAADRAAGLLQSSLLQSGGAISPEDDEALQSVA